MFYILFVIIMNKTEWSVTQDFGDYKVENMLFTYDESEQEQHVLDKMNADVVLNPYFIPLNPRMLQDGYSFVEASIFGFLEFFLRNNEKFYCTNEQMWKMLNVNEKTISLAISKLKDKWLIKLSYKMKGGGWKIRFIHLWDDITKSNVGTLQNVKYDITKSNDIYNKNIKNKNITNPKTLTLNKLDTKLANICKGDLTFTENVIERLNEYNNTRKKKLEKLTDKWFKLVIDKLVELWHGTEDWMIAVLKQSVEKGWEWLFEVKGYKPKVDYENNLQLFLTRLKTDYEWLKKEVGNDKFFELKQKALEYWAVNKLL